MAKNKTKRKILLRDPSNPEEKVLIKSVEDLSNRLWWAWLEGAYDVDFKDVAERARVHPKTVHNLVHGITRMPSLGTFVRVAHATGYRVTLVLLNARRQPNEAELRDDSHRQLMKQLGHLKKAKKK